MPGGWTNCHNLFILPVALSQAEPTQRVQRRVIATKLIEKLCSALPSLDVRKELAPCAQMLAQDPNANVRGSIAQRLGVIAQSLHNASDCGTLLLPCLIELCNDDDIGVREAILNTVAVCLPHFSKGILYLFLRKVIDLLIEHAIIDLLIELGILLIY
ncbi:unnamed protein product [Toxocara canis]|uniref:TIP120 domain-containing protein n=1 Tax=Toxocara canis TaxID=6265 RepID=A0A183VD66_TOXCA|nr:unnamed protein product [Toxocara canis]